MLCPDPRTLMTSQSEQCYVYPAGIYKNFWISSLLNLSCGETVWLIQIFALPKHSNQYWNQSLQESQVRGKYGPSVLEFLFNVSPTSRFWLQGQTSAVLFSCLSPVHFLVPNGLLSLPFLGKNYSLLPRFFLWIIFYKISVLSLQLQFLAGTQSSFLSLKA